MRKLPAMVALALSACAAARQPAAPVGDAPAAVPAGVTPLTVEQEEDAAALSADRLSPGGRIG